MDKNIEMMKKIIEAKKSSSTKVPSNKNDKTTGGTTARGKNSKKTGGLFDR